MTPPRAEWGLSEVILQPPANVDSDRHFFVGIDAGTSGIRVALRDEYAQKSRIFDFGANRAGGTRFSFPTAIAVSDQRLLFGDEAVEAGSTCRFVSFKAAFVHPRVEEELNSRWDRLELPQLPASPADFLYSISVARALELSLRSLTERGPSPAPRPVSYSFAIGAPVADSADSHPRFHRGLAFAILLAGWVGKSPLIADMVCAYREGWNRASKLCALPPEEQRLHVKSEAYSAIRGLGKFQQFGKNFLVVDIGATTTEMSVIRIGQDRLACYAARSIPVGVDDADRPLATAGADLIEVRVARHGNAGNGLNDEAVNALERTAKAMKTALGSVLKDAIDKNQDEKSWSEFHVVLVGGGSMVEPLTRVFRADELPHPWVSARHNLNPVVDPPEVVGASAKDVEPDEIFELPSVLGTCVPTYEDLDTVSPGHIEEVIPEYEDPLGELVRGQRPRWL
jgi:hypothetical protein